MCEDIERSASPKIEASPPGQAESSTASSVELEKSSTGSSPLPLLNTQTPLQIPQLSKTRQVLLGALMAMTSFTMVSQL